MSFASSGHAVFLFSDDLPLPNISGTDAVLLSASSPILSLLNNSNTIRLAIGSSSVSVDLTGIPVRGLAVQWDREKEEMELHYGSYAGWVRAGLRPCLDVLPENSVLKALRCGSALASTYALQQFTAAFGPLPKLNTAYPILNELSILGLSSTQPIGPNTTTVIGVS